MKPETVGMSAARLARLDKVMNRRYVDGGYLPGMLTQIYRQGQLVHTGIFGHMDLGRGKPMREDAIFRIYSMSKPITAVALMMLVEEGLIGLDDLVHSHIPVWKNLGVYASGMPSLLAEAPPSFLTTPALRPMKIVDLATHTSGLTYGFMMRTAVDAAYRRAKVTDRQTPGGLQGMVDQLAQIPLDFSPGTAWNYSVSIDVLGYLIEKLSGVGFGEFLRTRLFEPLGMNDTAFWVLPEKIERLSSCYQPESKGRGLKLQDDARESTYAEPPMLELGGGGLVSTAHDYLRFCRMMLNGGKLDGVQILSPKTVALFSLNYLPDGREVADMALPGMFSEFGLCRGRLFARLRGQRRRGQDPPAGLARRIFLGRCGRDRVLDRSRGTADGRVHDPGHRQRGAPDLTPRLAHLGLFGDDGIVRVSRRRWHAGES